MERRFAAQILQWYRVNGRSLPWRETADPYAILVSEIMLQQTQVDRVVPKYEAWLQRFPTWKSLSRASRADVLRLWSGLGYNNRAVRLHALAKLVVEEHEGKLPTTEEELRKLPGIGPYTAGAVMAFAYNVPGACIDVNIRRIVDRAFFTKSTRVDATQTEKTFLSSFPAHHATDYANALMDFGSMICTATKPKCEACPILAVCKSKGERPDEKKEREKRKQTPFLHSNRWHRGRILKTLGERSGLTAKALFLRIGSGDEQAFMRALEQLRHERIVSGRTAFRIAQR